jgi:hypothetical protein
MPKPSKLAEAMRRQKTGEALRLQKLANSGFGEAEYVLKSTGRRAGHHGASRVLTSPQVLVFVHAVGGRIARFVWSD